MQAELRFAPLDDTPRGTLANLLHNSYAALNDACWRREKETWLQFDADAYNNLETVGACVFLTTSGNDLAGFGSFDPRQRPRRGIIGHNCVLPQFRGQGIGTRQIKEILRRFRQRGIAEATVTTSEHPFFAAARHMYLHCGFVETRRYAGGPDARFKLIDYARLVDKTGIL